MTRSRGSFRAVAIALAVIVAAFGGPGTLAPGSVAADGPFIIGVTTSNDVVADDGLCSLREAIAVSNTGGFSGVNSGECLGSTSMDRIQFNIGSGVPVITLGSDLPPITAPVRLSGSGAATQVRITRMTGGTGLWIQSTATATTVRGLRIDGFSTGIQVDAANVTIAGNWIGPNSQNGITVNAAGSIIGGTRAAGINTECGGDCNLIKGNTTRGLYLNGSTGTVSGNFIGTGQLGAAATAATANGTGMFITQGTWLVGGTAAGQGNLVSGNTGAGLTLYMCVCTVKGNKIGTNNAGTAKLPNGGVGISTNGQGSVIGGNEAGAGNLVSGNTSHGIRFWDGSFSASGLTVYGNRIGTTISGGALGNGGRGIFVGGGSESKHVENAIIGNPALPGAANVIAHNVHEGIFVQDANHIQFRGNSIYSNDVANPEGILIVNPTVQPPVIQGLGPLHGTACAGCTIDVYSDAADEGKTYHGAATADGGGNWIFSGALTGPKVTATATDANSNTSMFSAPFTLPPPPKKPDGRIKKGSGNLVGNNIYNLTGLNQERTGTTTRGNTITFTVSIQNDSTSDRFKVLAAAGNTKYRIKYFRNSTEITNAVVAGTYQTPVMAKGATFAIQARVTVLNAADLGSSISRLVTISSVGDPTKKDVVKFTAKRS